MPPNAAVHDAVRTVPVDSPPMPHPDHVRPQAADLPAQEKTHSAVERVIAMIHRRYQEPLTLQDLAAEACYSTFHFTRLFHKKAGMPPGQFLTAVRLYHAKRLLATSDMSIVDVVTSVGYSSVGTFTTRFTNATGVSPSAFRDPSVNRLLTLIGPCGVRIPAAATVAAAECSGRRPVETTGAIVGSLQLPSGTDSTELLVGVFDSMAPQSGPVACHTIAASEAIEVYIQNIPVGLWHLVAIGSRRNTSGDHSTDQKTALLATTRTPIRVRKDEIAGAPSLRLTPPGPLTPPIATLFGPPPNGRGLGEAAARTKSSSALPRLTHPGVASAA
jgi:AraC family transcriptional regulator